MYKFGEFSDLPEDIVDGIKLIIDDLEKVGAEDLAIYYGYPIIELDGNSTLMKACIISRTGILALYTEEKEKIVYNRHLSKVMLESPDLSNIFFENPQGIIKFINIIDRKEIIRCLSQKEILSHGEFRQLNAIIQNIYGLNHKDDRTIKMQSSLGALIKKRNNEIAILDQDQFDTVYKKTTDHTRIRGLAGSGKTILLVKKMAYMHYKYRDLDMAYVFYTKSLKQYIENLFMAFYKDFEKYKEPDLSKIHILHCWGGNEMEGFYSMICRENDLYAKNWNEAKEIGGLDKFGYVCKDALEQKKYNMKPLLNYVFIDEAQDFSLYFFKLVLSSLKYMGKMVYAYDELQSLNDSAEMPSKNKIFGDIFCKDINLSICYRTPKEILVTAHALGLGIYKKKEDGSPDLVNMMQDYSIWKAVGYKEVEGTLGYGREVTLDRQEVIEYKPNECIEIFGVEDWKAQNKKVVCEIKRLLTEEEVLPEDILIIDLASINLSDDFKHFRSACIDEDLDCKIHLVNKDSALKFKRLGSIPFTTIFRAKGNEANIVFVINAQSRGSILTYSRNRLFTALTRAKFKAYIYGIDDSVMKTLMQEYEQVKAENFTLKFTYPTEKQLDKMKTISRNEAKDADILSKVSKSLGNNKNLTIEILKEQIGVATMDELIKKLQEIDKND